MKKQETTVQVSETEKRVLLNLHFLGYMGKMGSYNKSQRLELLNGLIAKELITKQCRLTELGHKYAKGEL